jgi:HPt (histidine-containing phosphotransfer) domain-containing protein
MVSSNTENSPVDAETIETLRADGPLLGELKELFVTEAATQLSAMAEGNRQGDAKTVAMAAHRLKGSAVTFGAHEMQRICIELEEGAKSGALNGTQEKIQQLSAECERVKRALDQVV